MLRPLLDYCFPLLSLSLSFSDRLIELYRILTLLNHRLRYCYTLHALEQLVHTSLHSFIDFVVGVTRRVYLFGWPKDLYIERHRVVEDALLVFHCTVWNDVLFNCVTKTVLGVDVNGTKNTLTTLRIVSTTTVFARSGSHRFFPQKMLAGQRFRRNEKIIIEIV